MDKQKLFTELLMNYAGNLENKLTENLLNQLENVLREQIAQEIEAVAPNHDWETNESENYISVKLASDIARGRYKK